MLGNFTVRIAATASYWLHRGNGKHEYTQYILPQGQIPILASGEILGPFSHRGVKKFFVRLYKELEERELKLPSNRKESHAVHSN